MRRAYPSPAIAIAFIALLAALSGTAVALPGKNTVDSGDIKQNSVRSGDIRKGNVKNSDLGANAVTSGKVRNDNLTGSDINEGTLGKVPSAASADSANTASTATSADSATSAGSADSVGGVRLRSFNFAVPGPDAPAQEILNIGGLSLSAGCVSAFLTFTAATTVDNAEVGSYSVEPDTAAQDPQNLVYEGDFDIGDTLNLVPTDEDEEVGSLRYTKADGSGVHVEWHASGGSNGTSNRCMVNGVASAF